MNKLNPVIFPTIFLSALLMASPGYAGAGHGDEGAKTAQKDEHGDEHGAEGGEHGGEEEEGRVHLTPEQMKSAGIRVQTLQLHALPIEVEAPGEIKLNAYATSEVTPRIDAQVVKRLVRLGDSVKAGQPLVVLSSVAMAEAQGELLVLANEWERVRKLGKKVVSQRRYLETRIAFQQARAKVLTYGMTEKQTETLLKNNTISQANGNFTLLSPQKGTIIHDDFILGQLVQPGQILFEITDESTLWVEARVNPKAVKDLRPGAPARVQMGKQWIDGKVIQIHHKLDEVTRTLAVRLQIPNPQDQLHPGEFVSVRIQTGSSDNQVLALPTDAIMRSPDGDWQVFIEMDKGEFEGKEIEIVRKMPGIAVIEGIPAGTRVVTAGAFFVQSEQAKSGFSVHNH